jgi:hypothetical protein
VSEALRLQSVLVRAGILAVLLGLGLLVPAGAVAAPQDVASTDAYLAAASTDLRAAIASMPTTIDASVAALDRRYAGECPRVAAGSIQDEAADPMTFEVAGALWSTAYHADAKIVDAFDRVVKPLRWSNATITRDVDGYAASVHELSVLPLPGLCGDMRAWAATGYSAIPASTTQFDRHVEAIEGHPLPLALLAPYEGPAQKALAARVAGLEARFEELEGELSQKWFDETLETLALPQ